jgi:hypothetical protein
MSDKLFLAKEADRIAVTLVILKAKNPEEAAVSFKVVHEYGTIS